MHALIGLPFMNKCSNLNTFQMFFKDKVTIFRTALISFPIKLRNRVCTIDFCDISIFIISFARRLGGRLTPFKIQDKLCVADVSGNYYFCTTPIVHTIFAIAAITLNFSGLNLQYFKSSHTITEASVGKLILGFFVVSLSFVTLLHLHKNCQQFVRIVNLLHNYDSLRLEFCNLKSKEIKMFLLQMPVFTIVLTSVTSAALFLQLRDNRNFVNLLLGLYVSYNLAWINTITCAVAFFGLFLRYSALYKGVR